MFEDIISEIQKIKYNLVDWIEAQKKSIDWQEIPGFENSTGGKYHGLKYIDESDELWLIFIDTTDSTKCGKYEINIRRVDSDICKKYPYIPKKDFPMEIFSRCIEGRGVWFISEYTGYLYCLKIDRIESFIKHIALPEIKDREKAAQ